MKEIRLSLPIVGGITVIYTGEEVEQKKRAVKNAFASFVRRITGKPKLEYCYSNNGHTYTPCPACGHGRQGGPGREDGVCPVHGKR